MLASCTTNQENWSMLGMYLATLAAFLAIKWRLRNSVKPLGFGAFFREWISGGQRLPM